MFRNFKKTFVIGSIILQLTFIQASNNIFFISCVLWKLSSWFLFQLNMVFASHFLDLIYKIIIQDCVSLCCATTSLSVCLVSAIQISQFFLLYQHPAPNSEPKGVRNICLRCVCHLNLRLVWDLFLLFLKMDSDLSTIKKKIKTEALEGEKLHIYMLTGGQALIFLFHQQN